jgi:hypothetical protein
MTWLAHVLRIVTLNSFQGPSNNGRPPRGQKKKAVSCPTAPSFPRTEETDKIRETRAGNIPSNKDILALTKVKKCDGFVKIWPQSAILMRNACVKGHVSLKSTQF